MIRFLALSFRLGNLCRSGSAFVSSSAAPASFLFRFAVELEDRHLLTDFFAHLFDSVPQPCCRFEVEIIGRLEHFFFKFVKVVERNHLGVRRASDHFANAFVRFRFRLNARADASRNRFRRYAVFFVVALLELTTASVSIIALRIDSVTLSAYRMTFALTFRALRPIVWMRRSASQEPFFIGV